MTGPLSPPRVPSRRTRWKPVGVRIGSLTSPDCMLVTRSPMNCGNWLMLRQPSLPRSSADCAFE